MMTHFDCGRYARWLLPCTAITFIGIALSRFLPGPLGAAIVAIIVTAIVALPASTPRRKRENRSRHSVLMEEIARALVSGGEPIDLPTKLLKTAIRRLGAHSGAILLRSDDCDRGLKGLCQFSVTDGFEIPASVGVHSSLHREIIQGGNRIVWHASPGQPILDGQFELERGSLVGFPLTVYIRRGEAQCVGAVVLLFDDPTKIDKELEESIEDFTQVAALTVAPNTQRRQVHQTLARTLEMLVNVFEGRCEYSEGHSKRVSEIAVNLGRKLGLGYESLEDLRLGTLLHDIGKIAIPENILNKPGKLSAEDYEVIKKHPEIGYEMCRPVQLPECVLKVVRNHHENLDGTGYPDGLSGSDLTLYMRIAAVADSFDAMCSRRAYRDPMEMNRVIAELTRNAGTQFDPVVVEKLKESLGEPWLIALYGTAANAVGEHAA